MTLIVLIIINHKFNFDHAPGQQCIVRRQDRIWYRGEVIEAKGDGAVIHFIDYGFTKFIESDLIRTPLAENGYLIILNIIMISLLYLS